MPTGYTAGIIDGTIKDFSSFAKLCARAFLIHLREEPLDSEFQEAKPSTYHTDEIKKAQNTLEKLNNTSDKVLFEQEKEKLITRIQDLIEKKEIGDKKKKEVEVFLEKAKKYIPPTEQHKGIAYFMVSQLEQTLNFDFSSYYEDTLKVTEKELNEIDVTKVRDSIKAEAEKDIEYHTKQYEREVESCEKYNTWYKSFIESLP